MDASAEQGMGHIELARWADLLVIAPATADLIARLAAGRADDLLTTVALATAAPKLIAPAMNQQMWADAATASNIAATDFWGTKFIINLIARHHRKVPTKDTGHYRIAIVK